MIDADAVNERLAGTGWVVEVQDDPDVAATVVLASGEIRADENFVNPGRLVAVLDGDVLHYSPTHEDDELVVVLTEYKDRRDHERGDHDAAPKFPCPLCLESWRATGR